MVLKLERKKKCEFTFQLDDLNSTVSTYKTSPKILASIGSYVEGGLKMKILV